MTNLDFDDVRTQIYNILRRTRTQILDAFDEHGWDAAYFDIDIDLSVSIDDKGVHITLEQERIE